MARVSKQMIRSTSPMSKPSSATEVATSDEVAGYVARLQPLLQSDAELQRASAAALEASRKWVERCEAEQGLRAILRRG